MNINPSYFDVAGFLLLALLPSFMHVVYAQDSRTPGFLIAALMVSFVLMRYIKFIRVPVNWLVSIMLILMWILLVAFSAGGVDYTSKQLLSLPAMIFSLFFAFLLAAWFEKCPPNRLYRLGSIACGIFFLIGWAGLLFKVSVFGYNSVSIFPFAEPAHFARIAGPIYVVVFFLAPRKYKLIIFMNSALQSILIQSLSLLLYTTIILLIVLQLRWGWFTFSIIVAATILAAGLVKNPVYLEHFTSRLTLSRESGNMTSLVMLQGVESAKNSLVNTRGLGLGFQMLGTEDPNEISLILDSILSQGGEMNRADGGFVAAKLIAELGLAGVILAGFVFVQILKSFIWLRRYWRACLRFKVNYSDYRLKLVVANSLIVTFFIEMFLRGGGYFSLTVVFFAFSLLYVRKSQVGLVG